MSSETKQKVIEAIDKLGRKVTAADVAAKTGLPVLKVTTDLNQIASETKGSLQVSTTGDVAYAFSPGFQNSYLTTGIAKFFEEALKMTGHAAYFLLRISFGIGLILSFLAVVVLILVVMFAGNRGNNDGDSGGGDFRFDFFDYMVLRDLFFWGSYNSTPEYYAYSDYNKPSVRNQQENNFLFNVYSFLFGDGDPNDHLEERKWQMIAQVIRKNHGTVSVDQLAPYTGVNPNNEDGMLPVLVRFNGRPEVTADGNIVYQFPDMQLSTGPMQLVNLAASLEEFPWKFTHVSAGDLVPVYILASVTFFGSLFLLGFFGSGFGFLTWLVWGLAGYGSLFFIVPFIRFLIISHLNIGIETRNGERNEYSNRLAHPDAKLAAKLKQVQALALKDKSFNDQQIEYRSDRDLLEQEFDASP